MSAASPASDARRRQLWQAGNWEELWQAVALPWLRQSARQAWREARPTVVLVPSRATGFYLHERVVEAGFHLAAIHFWTPSDARSNLLRFFPGLKPTPSREVLHLFATLAAEEVLARDPANRTAAAIAVEPASFIQTVDQLAAAGWDLAEVSDAPLRAVARQWRERLRQHGFQTVQEIDRELIVLAAGANPRVANLLVAGFDGACWPQWPILQAVIETAQTATVGLIAPKLGWEEMDQAWIGTWEERFGAAQSCEAVETIENRPQPFAPFQKALYAHETKTCKLEGDVLHFALARNVRGEAESILTTVLEWLAQGNVTRLGIVVPGVCALAREVASRLEAAGLSCDDAFGFTVPGSFERADWQAWRAWQESPALARLLELLEWLPVDSLLKEVMPGLTRGDLDFALRDAFKEMLLDDWTVLRAWLARSRRSRDVAAVAFLDLLQPLPLRAEWGAMLAATVTQWRRLGWNERADRLELNARGAAFLNAEPVTRTAFLRWLSEVAVSTQKQRGPEGNHRYGRIHLVPYNEAEKQRWSHLILTSLCEGVWPPSSADSGFLSRNELVRLNRRVRGLNTDSVQQGSQGEGHVRLESGKGLCLGPLERRQLAESQTLGMLENVDVALLLTARLGEEKGGGEALAPGEFFSRLYTLKTGRVLSDGAAEELAAKSEKRSPVAPVFSRIEVASSTSESVIATAQAYAIRRDADQPFGEFEFCLREPLSVMPSLSCGDWESALQGPATMWLRKFLRVQPVEEASVENVLKPVRGTWTHRWLSKVGTPRSNQFIAWPSLEAITARQEEVAAEQRAEVEAVLRSCGQKLPAWWESLWREARFLTNELTAVLAPAREWPGFSTEFQLEKTECDFSEGTLPPLLLRGRIDLLLAWILPQADQLPEELWLVDFKTGASSRAMTLSELSKGNGVQLALYALALRQQGATAVKASLLKPGELLREQMSLEKFDELRESWLELQRMQDTGRFGIHGELRAEFRHAKSYPLATLAIDADVLEEKWERSHPAWSGVL